MITHKALNARTSPDPSAVACYFAMKLQHELDVPIGVISSSWGGTRIEPWTPVAHDTLVGPPRCVRWVATPMFQRAHTLTPGTTVMVGSLGRVFYIQDESPVGFGGLAGQWRLIARDAFNGKLLWKRDVAPWDDEAWSWWSGGHEARFNHPYHINKRLVCSADRVFVTLGYNAPVSALDPATCRTLLEYRDTRMFDGRAGSDTSLGSS